MFHHPPYNGYTAELGGAKNRAWCVTDPSLGVCLQNRGDVIIKVRDLEKPKMSPLDIASRQKMASTKDKIFPKPSPGRIIKS